MTDIGSLLRESATLMVLGMAFVFIFLTLLVYLVSLMTRVLPREAPPIVGKAPTSPVQPVPGATTTHPQTIAAISAAVHRYRSSVNK